MPDLIDRFHDMLVAIITVIIGIFILFQLNTVLKIEFSSYIVGFFIFLLLALILKALVENE